MKKIKFKTKSYKVHECGENRDEIWLAIDFKKKLGKTDTNLRPCDHKYFNSVLFEQVLNREYRRIIGEYKQWAYLNALPEGVNVDSSKFLAVVTIELPESFFK
jgi:hypothetical protein